MLRRVDGFTNVNIMNAVEHRDLPIDHTHQGVTILRHEERIDIEATDGKCCEAAPVEAAMNCATSLARAGRPEVGHRHAHSNSKPKSVNTVKRKARRSFKRLRRLRMVPSETFSVRPISRFPVRPSACNSATICSSS